MQHGKMCIPSNQEEQKRRTEKYPFLQILVPHVTA